MEIKREDLERLLEHARPSLTPAEYEQLKAALDTLVYLAHLVGKKGTGCAGYHQRVGLQLARTSTRLFWRSPATRRIWARRSHLARREPPRVTPGTQLT